MDNMHAARPAYRAIDVVSVVNGVLLARGSEVCSIQIETTWKWYYEVRKS